MNPELKNFFTVNSLAAEWLVHPNTVYRLVEGKELSHYRVRGAIRIPRDAVEQYLTAHKVDAEVK